MDLIRNPLLEVDPKQYGRLLARKLPTVIRTEAENQRASAEIEELDRRHQEHSPEEREYFELLTVLVEAFEDEHYSLSGATPDSILRGLMEEHRLRQRDLLDVFGSSTDESAVSGDPIHCPSNYSAGGRATGFASTGPGLSTGTL